MIMNGSSTTYTILVCQGKLFFNVRLELEKVWRGNMITAIDMSLFI